MSILVVLSKTDRRFWAKKVKYILIYLNICGFLSEKGGYILKNVPKFSGASEQSKNCELDIGNKIATTYGGLFVQSPDPQARIDGIVWGVDEDAMAPVHLAIVEVKDRTAGPRPIRSNQYDTYLISKSKYIACQMAARVQKCDFVLGVRFSDQDMYCHPPDVGSPMFLQYCSVAMGGRTDRGRSRDREQCVFINIKGLFKEFTK